MKRLFCVIPLVFLLCFAFGCQDKAAMAELEKFRAQANVEEQNKELVRRYFKGVDTGDVESLFALVEQIFASDYIDHSATYEGHGIEGVREHIKFAFDTFGGMRHDLEELIAEGDKVCVRGTFQATQKGDLFGVQPTGMKLSCPGLWMFRVKEGKIQEGWINWDSLLSLGMQLGMELKPKEAEK